METRFYKQAYNQYTCQKLSGMSPCDNSETGIYKFAIIGGQLTIMPIMDRCAARLKAFTSEPLKRVN